MKEHAQGFRYSGLFPALVTVLITGALFLGLPSKVQAAELITRAGGEPVVVQQGETVEKVLVFDTDAQIAGRVTDIVIVINGNVTLEPTANVDLVVDLGGHVANASTSVKSGIVELNWTERMSREFLFGGLLVLGVGFIKVFMSIISIMLLSVGGAMLAKHLETTRDTFAPVPARMLGIGFTSALIVAVVLVLLSLSVIGIPLAALLFFLSFVAAGVGLLPLMDYWGQRFLHPVRYGSFGLKYWIMLSVLYVALANIPLLGAVFSMGSLLAGLGLMVAWGIRHRQVRS